MIDVCSQTEKPLLTLEETQYRIRTSVDCISDTEHAMLHDALGRVLAESVIAPIDLPQYKNAAMDGYAVASSDIDEEHPFSLRLVGTAWAGKPFQGEIQQGQCIRIFTGAVIPDTLDTVIMQEFVEQIDDRILFPAGIKAGENVRHPGEDIKKNSVLIAAPKQLCAADLGLLASAGIIQTQVKRKIKIAFLSTGDELQPVGEVLSPGNIYDSNRYLLAGLLDHSLLSLTDLGIARDDKPTLERLIVDAAQTHDVIITTGGASVGEADFIHEILQQIGQVDLWKIAIKPGKPLTYGKIGKCRLFGLPGNPVAVIATFQRIVLPSLKYMAGLPPEKPLRLMAACKDSIKRKPGRLEFMRGILTQDENGEHQVALAGKQGSHILSSMSKANCFIVLPSGCRIVQPGDLVVIEPFSTWLALY